MNHTAYKDTFDFAASAGALEGYVFQKENLDPAQLNNWIKNLASQYEALPMEIRERIQPSLDRTLGRAVQSLISLLGEDHAHVVTLTSLIQGDLPSGPDDFKKEIAEKAQRFGK